MRDRKQTESSLERERAREEKWEWRKRKHCGNNNSCRQKVKNNRWSEVVQGL